MRIQIFFLGASITLNALPAIATVTQYAPQDSITPIATHVIEEIKVEATRTNRSVANVPTRTEVLTEEIDEAASMEPSRIAHLITHSTGIQVQKIGRAHV